jgi:hypothetical protein
MNQRFTLSSAFAASRAQALEFVQVSASYTPLTRLLHASYTHSLLATRTHSLPANRMLARRYDAFSGKEGVVKME